MVDIVPIGEKHIGGFHDALDAVCRERRFLARFEAPPIETTRAFVRDNIARHAPQFVAVDGETVVGWCDISPLERDTLRHGGTLGMGIIDGYRRQGIGTRLLAATIAGARRIGLERIELEVYESNAPAIALYQRHGFRIEGRKIKACKIDGRYDNILVMALLL